jgi:SET domain-containing protein
MCIGVGCGRLVQPPYPAHCCPSCVRRLYGVEVRSTAFTSWGLFAVRPLKRGKWSLPYLGIRKTVADCLDTTYFLHLDSDQDSDQEGIDASSLEVSSVARYLNDTPLSPTKLGTQGDSVSPNAVFEVSPTRAVVSLLRDVCAGEELLADYGEEYWKFGGRQQERHRSSTAYYAITTPTTHRQLR